MISSQPDVSIILVNWNTRELLLAALGSLTDATKEIGAEVFVVDNNSADGSVQAVQDMYPHIHIIANCSNVGFAAANNQAIQGSRARYVLLLNSDTFAMQGSVTALVRFMDLHSNVGIVGAQLLNRDGTLQPSWASFPTLWSALLGKNIRRRRLYATSNGVVAYDVDWVGGACLMIRRSAMDQVGLLDEQFFMYSEEMDWCFRIKQHDWNVCYYPEAQVIHLGGQSSRLNNARMEGELYRSKLIFFHKHYGRKSALVLGMMFLISSLAKPVTSWFRHYSARSEEAPSTYREAFIRVCLIAQSIRKIAAIQV
jgi:GT2 family glycosyltransferase